MEKKNKTNWTLYDTPEQNPDTKKWEIRVRDANKELLKTVERNSEQEAHQYIKDKILENTKK